MATGTESLVSIQVHGLRELEEELAKFGPEVAKRTLRAAVKKAGEPIREEAARLAPRGTGDKKGPHLADDIVLRIGAKKGKSFSEVLFGVESGSVTAQIGFTKETFYGMFQEFGTRFHAAHPFLRPAFDNESENAVRMIAAELKRGIEAQAKKAAKRFSRFKRGA